MSIKSYSLWTMVAALLFLIPLGVTAHEKKHKKNIQQKSDSHWAAPQKESRRSNPVPATDVSLLNGQNLFEENCASCHGIKADGKGSVGDDMNPKPTNLRAMAGHHTDGDLAWKIKNGRGDMPGWIDSFSEEEIWDLVNYIQNLKKAH